MVLKSADDFRGLNLIELMVNYQGGFLRRGLLGEIFFNFSKLSGLDFRYLAIPLCVAAFVYVVIFLLKKFQEYKIHWWLLPLSFCLGASYGCLIRKDFIILSMFALMLFSYKSRRIDSNLKLILITAISIVALLMYEPSFFMYIPLMWLVIFTDKSIGKFHRLTYTVLTLGAMAFLTIVGIGDVDVAYRMHEAWHNLLPSVIPSEMSEAERFLGWGLVDSLKSNGSVFYSFGWTSELYKIIVLIVTPYIFMRYPFVAAYGEKRFPCSYGVWSAVILFQILSQLPLWLGLSIDFGRMFMHVFVTSAMLVFILPSATLSRLFPSWYLGKVVSLNKWVDKLIPNNLITMMIILLFFGQGFMGYNLHDIFSSSVLGGVLYNFYSFYLEFIVA